MCIKYAHSQGFHQKYGLLSNYRSILMLKKTRLMLRILMKRKDARHEIKGVHE